MPVFAVIFWSLAAFTVVATLLGAGGKPRWYWWAALTSYVCGFLGSFSIGVYVLGLTFVLALIATGHSLHLVRSWWHSACAVVLGLGLWWLAVNMIDDAWLFLPFRLLTPFLSGGSSGSGSGSCIQVNSVLKCTPG